MKYLYTITFFIVLFGLKSFAGTDTLTIMHYNLMYYDKEYSECTSTTNNVDSKDAYLKTIVKYVSPDILTVNEVNSAISSVERIKTNALNIDGVTKYRRADFSGSFLSNMIYYNSEKLVLKSQKAIATSPRETNVYRLYLKTQSLANGDTVFLTCFITHLKAETGEANEDKRTATANTIMAYISSNNITGNILLMGDMNLYSGSEGAFEAFTSETGSNGFRFYDPINMVGDWNSNYSFRTIHTQSTHTESNGCFSTGGMDDRFDFILSSTEIINGTNGLNFSSYKAIAQDGKRYNQSLISPDNSSVPAEVLSALYNMSDHLPVQMKLVYNGALSGINTPTETYKITYNNPAPEKLKIQIADQNLTISRLSIYSAVGQNLFTATYGNGNQSVEVNTSNFNSGLFIVKILLSNGCNKSFKVIK